MPLRQGQYDGPLPSGLLSTVPAWAMLEPMNSTYARPILSAVAGTAAMAAVVIPYDPEWFVRWGVAIGVAYAAWGVAYWSARA